MTINLQNKYPGRFDPVSADYPQGKFKNRSSPTAQDGSYMERDWLNDWAGFFGALLRNAGITPNGNVDTAQASQLYSALIGGIVKTAGLRDVGRGAGQIPDMSFFTKGSGWVKYPDGTIIQNGTSISGNLGYPSAITLPVPFTVSFTVVASYDTTTGSGAADCPSFATTPIGLTGFYLSSSRTTGAGAGGRWIAIGV